MPQLMVFRCELLYTNFSFEYYAYGKLFPHREDGDLIPQVTIQALVNSHLDIVDFRVVDPGTPDETLDDGRQWRSLDRRY